MQMSKPDDEPRPKGPTPMKYLMLVCTDPDYTPGQGDSFTTFEYGDPYPGQWARFLDARVTAGVFYSVNMPDGTTTRPSSPPRLPRARSSSRGSACRC